jgi:murein DD-endopeptidase MepM/ murein hydrolase activator NlpD
LLLLHLRAHERKPRPRIARWLAAAFAVAFGFGAGLGFIDRPEPGVGPATVELAPSAIVAAVQPTPAAVAAPPAAAQPASLPEPVVLTGILKRGQTLAESLNAHGVSADRIHVLVSEMAPVLNFRYSKPGDRYDLALSPGGEIVSFRYERSPAEYYELTREGDRFVAAAHKPEILRSRVRIAGLVDSSLYAAVEALGESRALAEDFAEIFAWDVDFSRGVRRGDEFSILYERLSTRDAQGREHYLRPGQILAARYSTTDDDFRAVYFESEQGRGAYYRPNGEPMQRQFLKAPLDYKRISSGFTSSRLHPILGIRRPHLGIDYAAGYGTPVWSVAHGVVVHRGYQGGFGNLVKIRHVNGYVSYYAHLSRYSPGLRVGDRIDQKQVVGYVGSTGLSTGPHLCFRLAKEGEYVNPALMHARGGDPIPRRARGRFDAHSTDLLAALDPRPLVVTNEAL